MSHVIEPKPAQRWTIEVDDDNAADVFIPNMPEPARLLANLVRRAGLGATIEVCDWPREVPS
jgi:hypothetical protein